MTYVGDISYDLKWFQFTYPYTEEKRSLGLGARFLYFHFSALVWRLFLFWKKQKKNDYHECLKFSLLNKVMFAKVRINWITNKLLPNFEFLQPYKHAYKAHAIWLDIQTSFSFMTYKAFTKHFLCIVKPVNADNRYLIHAIFILIQDQKSINELTKLLRNWMKFYVLFLYFYIWACKTVHIFAKIQIK